MTPARLGAVATGCTAIGGEPPARLDEAPHAEPRPRSEAALRRSLLRWALVHVGVVAAGSAALGATWGAGAGAILAYQLAVLARGLGDNRASPGEPLRDRLGLATAITLTRGLCLAVLGGFAIALPATTLPPGLAGAAPWLGAILYAAVAVGDGVDGAVARIRGTTSVLGARLDVSLDALGLLVGPLLAVRLGALPPWYLALGAAYYLFRAGLWARRAVGRTVYEHRLRPSAHSRMFAGIQMGLVIAALTPGVSPDVAWIAATLFMAPVLAGFSRDWGVATGVFDPAGAAYRRGIARLLHLTRNVLPAVVRITLPVPVTLSLGALAEVSPVLAGGCAALAIAMCAGLAARGAALGWLLLGATLAPAPLTMAPALAVAGAAILLLLGPGPRSVASPEERWLLTKPGRPRAAERDPEASARAPAEAER